MPRGERVGWFLTREELDFVEHVLDATNFDDSADNERAEEMAMELDRLAMGIGWRSAE